MQSVELPPILVRERLRHLAHPGEGLDGTVTPGGLVLLKMDMHDWLRRGWLSGVTGFTLQGVDYMWCVWVRELG